MRSDAENLGADNSMIPFHVERENGRLAHLLRPGFRRAFVADLPKLNPLSLDRRSMLIASSILTTGVLTPSQRADAAPALFLPIVPLFLAGLKWLAASVVSGIIGGLADDFARRKWDEFKEGDDYRVIDPKKTRSYGELDLIYGTPVLVPSFPKVPRRRLKNFGVYLEFPEDYELDHAHAAAEYEHAFKLQLNKEAPEKVGKLELEHAELYPTKFHSMNACPRFKFDGGAASLISLKRANRAYFENDEEHVKPEQVKWKAVRRKESGVEYDVFGAMKNEKEFVFGVPKGE